jgi:hypothetical protein
MAVSIYFFAFEDLTIEIWKEFMVKTGIFEIIEKLIQIKKSNYLITKTFRDFAQINAYSLNTFKNALPFIKRLSESLFENYNAHHKFYMSYLFLAIVDFEKLNFSVENLNINNVKDLITLVIVHNKKNIIKPLDGTFNDFILVTQN